MIVERYWDEFIRMLGCDGWKGKRDYLAYIAATGCPERQFRDEFAYFLEKKLGSRFFVERDYLLTGTRPGENRFVDLVVFSGKPGKNPENDSRLIVCLMEFKTAYSNSRGSIGKWLRSLQEQWWYWEKKYRGKVASVFVVGDFFREDRATPKFGKYLDEARDKYKAKFVGKDEKANIHEWHFCEVEKVVKKLCRRKIIPGESKSEGVHFKTFFIRKFKKEK